MRELLSYGTTISKDVSLAMKQCEVECAKSLDQLSNIIYLSKDFPTNLNAKDIKKQDLALISKSDFSCQID